MAAPQGGIEDGEAAAAAVLREIEEETGIGREELTLLGEHPVVLGYELPEEHRSEKTGRGQCHRWFLFRIADGARVQPRAGSEFTRHRWSSMGEVVAEAVHFRRGVYGELLRYFGAILGGSSRESRRSD